MTGKKLIWLVMPGEPFTSQVIQCAFAQFKMSATISEAGTPQQLWKTLVFNLMHSDQYTYKMNICQTLRTVTKGEILILV